MAHPSSGFDAAAESISSGATRASRRPFAETCPSPRRELLCRTSCVMRVVAAVGPLALAAFDVYSFRKSCLGSARACWAIRVVYLPVYLIAIAWAVAVAVSLYRIATHRRGMPDSVHASLAALVAAGASVSAGLATVRIVQLRVMSPFSGWLLVSLLVATALFAWNDFAWALWGWKWTATRRVDAEDLAGDESECKNGTREVRESSS